MSKVKKSEKTHYELLFIAPNKFTDEEAEAVNEKIKKLITDNDGEITYSEDWGKKRMAYTIDGYNHGYYKLLEFNLPAIAMPKIDNTLRLANDVLRHQIVKIKQRTSEQIEKDKKTSEELYRLRRSDRGSDAKAEDEVKASPVAEVKEAVKEDVVEKEEVKTSAKKKTDLKDLDQKLDDILDADNLI
jgi:small subunit ribosomal protein S6